MGVLEKRSALDDGRQDEAAKLETCSPLEDGLEIVDPHAVPLQGQALQFRRLVNRADGVAGWCHQPSGFDHSGHYHLAPELILGLRGSALTKIGDDWCPVGAEQCLVPGSMVMHHTKTESDAFECLYFFPDGPQQNRHYFRSGDSEPCAVGRPHVTPAPAHNEQGWQQVVDDPAWSAALCSLRVGERINPRRHRYCYVLSGAIRIEVAGEAGPTNMVLSSMLAADAQLVRGLDGALPFRIVAVRAARLFFCHPKSGFGKEGVDRTSADGKPVLKKPRAADV